jgi:deoxycytidylate deaminase
MVETEIKNTLVFNELGLKEINKHLEAALEKATCTKRAVGAVLVITTKWFYRLIEGWNGPPDEFKEYCNPCPRRDSPSGTDMEKCPAVHAEMRAVLNALGESQSEGPLELYITCGLPCKDCMKELIIAGVKAIVSPYPLDMGERDDGFKDGDTYNFNLSYELMKAAGIEYVHEPELVKGATAHVKIK